MRARAAVLMLALLLLALFGAVLLFGAAMTRPVTYDEDQYIAAGVFAQTLLPYRDFTYLQAPLYPFVLAAAFKLSGGWYLLTGRLVTFVLALGSAGVLWGLLRRLGADRLLASVLMAACLASPFLTAPLSNTRNDALPLALFLAGLSVHLRAGAFPGRALAALLLGLAVEAKVSYVFGPLALGVHALFAPRERLAPVLLGTALAALPAVLCGWAAPEAFRFGLLDFHLAGPADWYGREGLGAQLGLPARAMVFVDWLTFGGNLTLVAIPGALAIVATARHRKWKRPGRLLVGLLAAATLLALLPAPGWPMYFAATAPLLACCAAHLWRVTEHTASARRKRILVLVAALPAVPVLALNAADLPDLLQRDRWVGVQAHATAATLHDALATAGHPGGEIATLFPRAVMDRNPVRPEFAAGPFVFRSGDVWPAGRLARLHALSPGTLPAAFDAAPPAAIYAGLYPTAWRTAMDGALIGYAEKHGWRLVHTGADGGRLWVRP